MDAQKRRWIYWIATASHLFSLMLFGIWLSQTDVMFGHYSGPWQLLIVIVCGATLGLSGYSFLGITMLLESKESKEQSRRSCFLITGTAILTIISILMILIAIPELKRAFHYRRLYGEFFSTTHGTRI